MEYKDEQQCKYLGFDTGGLMAHADSILQDEFNGVSTAEDGTHVVCPGDIHSLQKGE